MLQSLSNTVIGVHIPSEEDEKFVKEEIEKTKLLPEEECIAKRNFIEGILFRGQAAEKGGNIYRKTTHQIIGYEPDGLPVLKRIRF